MSADVMMGRIGAGDVSGRGESVYDRLEAGGWHSIKSPHCMRHTDCFRKGNRRCFIANTWEPGQRAATFYYAIEGQPAVDSFGQRYWKQVEVIETDSNFPAEALEKLRKETQP